MSQLLSQGLQQVEQDCSKGWYSLAHSKLSALEAEFGDLPSIRGIRKRYYLPLDHVVEAAGDGQNEGHSNFVSFGDHGPRKGDVKAFELLERKAVPDQNIVPPSGAVHYMFNHLPQAPYPVKFYRVPNAKLSVDRRKNYQWQFYIFDENDNYLEELSLGDDPFLLKGERTKKSGAWAFAEDKFTKFNVCHLLFDKLARFYEIQSVENITNLVCFSDEQYATDLFDLLGLGAMHPSKILGDCFTVEVDELVFCSSSKRFSHPGNNCSPYLKHGVQEILSALDRAPTHGVRAEKKGDRIYVDREGGKTRRIKNQAEIDTVLRKHGFVSVRFEDMSLEEQIRLAKDAACVVGVHGAGLTNIAFCKPQTPVLEILPAQYATHAYWWAARALELDYDAFVTPCDKEDAPIDHQTYDHALAVKSGKIRDDIYVDPEKFDKKLTEFCKKLV